MGQFIDRPCSSVCSLLYALTSRRKSKHKRQCLLTCYSFVKNKRIKIAVHYMTEWQSTEIGGADNLSESNDG